MHDGKNYIRTLVAVLIVMVVLAVLYFYFVPMVYGQGVLPSPTHRPIKTPTSAPTEPPDEAQLYLPIIRNNFPYRPTSAPTDQP
jgi:hypothetical protein